MRAIAALAAIDAAPFDDRAAPRGADEPQRSASAARSAAGTRLGEATKIELNYAPLRRPTVMLPVSSFVVEATGRAPEVPQLACVGIIETAAENWCRSLTRRTAMEMAGQPRSGPDTQPAEIAALACGIAETDAQEFAGQYPAYAADIAGETRKALDALRSDPMYRQRYVRFMTLLSGSGSAPSPPGAHPRWSCRDRRAWSEWRP